MSLGITTWEPQQVYDIWHDRAAFHFLTEDHDRTAYVERLTRAVKPGGHAIIATFAPDGPERCSGLPVVRYDAESLSQALGGAFELVETRRHIHVTPGRHSNGSSSACSVAGEIGGLGQLTILDRAAKWLCPEKNL